MVGGGSAEDALGLVLGDPTCAASVPPGCRGAQGVEVPAGRLGWGRGTGRWLPPGEGDDTAPREACAFTVAESPKRVLPTRRHSGHCRAL